jgi:uncharacterized protein (DUF362 family)
MEATHTARSTVFLRDVAPASIDATVEEVMERCDWQALVPAHGTVVIKPNLCTAVCDKIEMSNTDCTLTAAVCKVLLKKTKNIYLGESDGLRQTAHEAFAASGYAQMASDLGVGLVNFSESELTPVRLDPVREIEMPRLLLNADVFITLPVLKTHSLTYFTGTLKNQWGCVPQYDRILLHKHLDPMLVSIHQRLNPVLSIMDGIVGMEGRGPVNGRPRRLNLILASRDGVALDAAAMRLVGLDPHLSRHILLATQAGLGRLEAEDIDLDGDWAGHSTRFEPAILDIAQAAMNYMTRYRWFVRGMLENDYIFYPVRRAVQVLRRVGLVEGA